MILVNSSFLFLRAARLYNLTYGIILFSTDLTAMKFIKSVNSLTEGKKKKKGGGSKKLEINVLEQDTVWC